MTIQEDGKSHLVQVMRFKIRDSNFTSKVENKCLNVCE